MINIYKSPQSQILYIETVTEGHAEDFQYTRDTVDTDKFTIDRKNTNIIEVNKALYSTFTGKDVNGNIITFADADEFETYLIAQLQIDPIGGNIAYVNATHTYKAFSNSQTNINNSTNYEPALYKAAVAGTYDISVFSPVANGVQLLKDLEDLTIIASIFVIDNVGQRTSLGVSITIDGVVSTIEDTGYIRRISGSNEDLHQVIETFPSLSAGTVITVSKRRQGVASTNANGIEDKGILSIQGVEPDQGTVITGLPAPVITSISLA